MGGDGGPTTAYDATMNNLERAAGRMTRRALLGAASTAGLAGLAACGGGADAPPPSPRPTPPTYQGPGLPQLTVEEVLRGDDAELSQVFRAIRVNDTVVLGGRDRDDQGAVAVLDIDAAEVRWERPDGNEASLDSGPAYLMFSDGWAVDDGRAGVLLEQYVRGPERGRTVERGLAALSLDDRTPRWSAVLLPAVSRDDPDTQQGRDQSVHVVATGPQVVVVNIGGDAINGVTWNSHQKGQVPRTVGLDPRSGTKLWEVPDTLTQLAVGDRLLAVRGSGPDDSTAVALDPVSGEDLWTLEGQPSAHWVTGDGDLGVVVAGGATRLVGLTDGALGPVVPVGSPGIGDPLIAVVATTDSVPYAAWGSQSDHYRLLSQALADPEPLWAAEVFDDFTLVVAGGGGYAWAKPGDVDEVMAADRTGATRCEAIPGSPRAVLGDLVVTDGVAGGFAVHRFRPA